MLAMEKKIIWNKIISTESLSMLGIGNNLSIFKITNSGISTKILNEKNIIFSAIRIQISAGIGARGIDYPETATVL